jgi:hypothetical protein
VFAKWQCVQEEEGVTRATQAATLQNGSVYTMCTLHLLWVAVPPAVLAHLVIQHSACLLLKPPSICFPAAVTCMHLPLCLQSCAFWTERYKDTITQLLHKHTGGKRIVWRPVVGILKEEGLDYTSSSDGGSNEAVVSSSTDEQVSPLSSLVGDASSSSSSGDGVVETVEVKQAGLTFLATPEEGQKTGTGHIHSFHACFCVAFVSVVEGLLLHCLQLSAS